MRARVNNSSASSSPRSAKTLPDPSSYSMGLLCFFGIFGELLRFFEAFLNQIHILFRCFLPGLGFLLKGMEDIDPAFQLHGDHCAERVGGIADRDLKYATAHPKKGFSVFGHAPKLEQLELVADHLLRAGR